MIRSLNVLVMLAVMGTVSVVCGAGCGPVQAGEAITKVEAASLPPSKRTSVGLYVTAKEAGQALADDSQLLLLDVRSVSEVTFVGAPPNAYNVPFLMFLGAAEARATKNKYVMVKNPDFADAVDELMSRLGKDKSARVYVMCRSGGRSAAAVNVLHKRGYTQVISVVDGFEGGSDKSGRRTLNGWKNSGLAWGYKLAEDHRYVAPAAAQ